MPGHISRDHVNGYKVFFTCSVFAIVPTFILTPLTYLGGVFYSISLLPEFWQKVSAFNPILYMVNGFRYGILGVSDVEIGYAYVIMTVFTIVLASLCLWLLHRGTGLRS